MQNIKVEWEKFIWKFKRLLTVGNKDARAKAISHIKIILFGEFYLLVIKLLIFYIMDIFYFLININLFLPYNFIK